MFKAFDRAPPHFGADTMHNLLSGSGGDRLGNLGDPGVGNTVEELGCCGPDLRPAATRG
jgi:hypothetical protein